MIAIFFYDTNNYWLKGNTPLPLSRGEFVYLLKIAVCFDDVFILDDASNELWLEKHTPCPSREGNSFIFKKSNCLFWWVLCILDNARNELWLERHTPAPLEKGIRISLKE